MLAERVRQGSSSDVVRQFNRPHTPRNLLKILLLLKVLISLKVLLGLTLKNLAIEELEMTRCKKTAFTSSTATSYVLVRESGSLETKTNTQGYP